MTAPVSTNWIRAACVGAALGGIFWAIAFDLYVRSHGATATAVSLGGAGVAILVVGLLAYRFTPNPAARTYAAALAIAPLTGAAPLLPFAIAGLIGHLL